MEAKLDLVLNLNEEGRRHGRRELQIRVQYKLIYSGQDAMNVSIVRVVDGMAEGICVVWGEKLQKERGNIEAHSEKKNSNKNNGELINI